MPTGPNPPDSGVDETGSGAGIWTNPGNVTASDATYATIGVSSMASPLTSNYLVVTDFDFAISSNQVIDGIEVAVVRFLDTSLGAGTATDNSVKLVVAGVISGSDIDTGASWATASQTDTLGSSTELGGLSLTYSDVNNTGFGVAFKVDLTCSSVTVTAKVDYVTITVYHHTFVDAEGPQKSVIRRRMRDSMWYFRQSTASQEMPLGPFLDTADGFTPMTALTIANTDIKIQKFGSTTQASKNSGGATHIANGNYYAVFDATDTDTVGSGRVSCYMSGALPVWLDFIVLDEAVYDWWFGATAPTTAGSAVNVTQINGTSITGTGSQVADAFVAQYNVATPTFTNQCVNQTGDSYGIVNSGTHGNAAIKGYVDDIGAAGAGLTAIPWNAAWDAEVQSEVQDAIEANNLDHLVKIAVDTNFATTVHLDSVIGQLADNGTTATFDRTTDSLEAARDNIGTAGAGLTVDANTVPNGTGTATAGAATTITIQTALGANDRCIGCEIDLTGGTGSGQTRTITDYDNGTKVVTVDRPWVTNPDNTTTYKIRHANSAVSTVCRIGNAFTSSAGTEVRVSAWLERNGQVVTTYAASASCTFTFREHGSGSDLFSVTDSAVNAQGIFEATQATPGFTSDRLYLASAAITEGGNVFTTREPVPVFG